MRLLKYLTYALIAMSIGCNESDSLDERKSLKKDLQFEVDTLRLGNVRQGDTIEKNLSNTIVEISAINTTCGCTRILNFPDQISPNSKGFVQIQYIPDEAVGKQYNRIQILTNSQPKIKGIEVYANIKK